MLSLKRISTLSTSVKSSLPILAEISVQQKRNATQYEHYMKYGQGGRNSFNGNIVTVFGGTGFLGRYVINRLAKVGTQLIVPYRGSEDDVRHIRLMGDLGQIVFLEYDYRDYDSIMKAVSHSTCVINLVGRNFSTRNFKMQDCLIDSAAAFAKAASESNVRKLIHVSHLGANHYSRSEFMRGKALGEKAVMKAFPSATIMRPADAYGEEDRYLNKYAYFRKLSYVPLVAGGWKTTKRPVYITDVAQAIVQAALSEGHMGKTYELYGPEEYYLYDLVDFAFKIIREPLAVAPIPLKLYKMFGWLAEQSIFEPKLTQDMVLREFLSDVPRDGAYTFKDLGITPTSINDAGLLLLRRHRDYQVFEDEKTDDDVCKPITAYL